MNASEVQVIRERRRSERRSAERRRAPGVLSGSDRRRVRNPAGRRIDDRRRMQEAAGASRREGAESLRLVVRFQLGDQDAFKVLYERHFDAVYAYLRTVLRDRHQAEDGAQEVFLRALQALPRFEFRGSRFEAWLFRIVRNHALNLKLRSGRVSPADPASLDTWRDRRDSASTETGTDDDLLALIERLPAAQRQVIVLRYMVELEWNEIAGMLARSDGAVRQLEQRALAYLRRRLAAARSPSASRTRQLPMRRHSQPSPVAARRRAALLAGIRAA